MRAQAAGHARSLANLASTTSFSGIDECFNAFEWRITVAVWA